MGAIEAPSFGRIYGRGRNRIFGIAAPGWFMKTEYRAAYYDRITLPMTFTPAFGGLALSAESITFKPWVQTVSTSIVYRF
jgi:outer membrane immunogenic protein